MAVLYCGSDVIAAVALVWCCCGAAVIRNGIESCLAVLGKAGGASVGNGGSLANGLGWDGGAL